MPSFAVAFFFRARNLSPLLARCYSQVAAAAAVEDNFEESCKDRRRRRRRRLTTCYPAAAVPCHTLIFGLNHKTLFLSETGIPQTFIWRPISLWRKKTGCLHLPEFHHPFSIYPDDEFVVEDLSPLFQQSQKGKRRRRNANSSSQFFLSLSITMCRSSFGRFKLTGHHSPPTLFGRSSATTEYKLYLYGGFDLLSGLIEKAANHSYGRFFILALAG